MLIGQVEVQKMPKLQQSSSQAANKQTISIWDYPVKYIVQITSELAGLCL